MVYAAPLMRLSWLVIAALACLSFVAHAQSLPGNVVLGMSAAELQQARPTAKRVAHPARLAGGLVGSWSDDTISLAGAALTPTFFFADGRLERIEYLARDGDPAAYASLLAWGRSTWGAELAADAPEGSYASWSSGDLDAYLQRANTARGEQVRLVVKHRALKDAGEL